MTSSCDPLYPNPFFIELLFAYHASYVIDRMLTQLFGVAELFRVLTQNRAMTAAAMRGVRFLSASATDPLSASIQASLDAMRAAGTLKVEREITGAQEASVGERKALYLPACRQHGH